MIRKKTSFIFYIIAMVGIITLHAQDGAYLNSYTKLYPNSIPNAAPTSDDIYSTPKDIAVFVSLKSIGARVIYPSDGTEYLETELYGVRGRLFLRVVESFLYSIRDVRFMPYKVDNLPTNLLKRAQGYMREKKTDVLISEKIKQDSKKNDEKNSIAQGDKQKENSAPVNKLSVIEYVDGQYSVPRQYDESNSFSFVLDIIVIKKSKRNSLERYIHGKKSYTETYRYTTKGALRTLVRKYSNGTLEQFLYYFTGGGLEEVFHQERDGKSYKQRFTTSGELRQQEEFDDKDAVIYNLTNDFDEQGLIKKKNIVDFKKKERIITYYIDGREARVERYIIKRKDESTEQILIEILQYNYNADSRLSKKESKGVSNKKILKSVFDKDGALIKTQEFIDGKISIEIEEKGNKKNIKTFFLDEIPVIRVYYNGEYKEKEEVINNGKIVETRE